MLAASTFADRLLSQHHDTFNRPASQTKDDSWQELISSKRLTKAKQLQEERSRRGQGANLIDCLQYGDKGWILTYDEDIRTALGQKSRKDARGAIKEMERIRNNLAHTQGILPTGWQRIVIACSRLERNLEVITERLQQVKQTKGQE